MALAGRFVRPPGFPVAAYRAMEFFCNAVVSLSPPASFEEVDWSPQAGLTRVPLKPVWKGEAAITPNKDWRARNRTFGGASTGTHAYRVQLLHSGKNLLHPRDQWGRPGSEFPRVGEGWLLRIEEMPGDKTYAGAVLVVRNAVFDSQKWQPTLLCDVLTDDDGHQA